MSPLDFGRKAMAAALNMSEEQFVAEYRSGEVSPPDRVRFREPRWSVAALGLEINKRLPEGLDGYEQLVHAMEALQRAERAEGWHGDH